MKSLIIVVILSVCVGSSSLAQPPRKLPTSLGDPARDLPAKPLSPAEAARERDAVIKAVHEEIVSFSSDEVLASSIDGRWKVHTRKLILKDFANDRAAAIEAARIIQDLRVNQLGHVAGAQPAFEYWLSDGKAPKGTNARLVVVPIAGRTLRAESVGGAWMLTDGQKGIYNFGNDAEAAKRAATLCWKYGFNQLGVMGSPQPTMLYPMLDPRQASIDKVSPMANPMPLGVLNDADKTGLLLPGNVYAGPKVPFDVKKLEAKRDARGWMLLHNGEELARFGADEPQARSAIKVLQNARPTDMARIGNMGIPFFLSEGRPIHGEPLGATKLSLRPDLIKVQKLRETWWLFEENRPILEAGTKDDAELILKVLRAFGIKTLCLFGRPETGGLRLFTAGR